MPTPNWLRGPDWDGLLLAGKPVPGVAYVDVTLPSGLHEKKPRGAKKGRVVDEGRPPANVDIRIVLSYEELVEFEAEIIPVLEPRARTKGGYPLEITHPNCRLWGIGVVLIGHIDSPSPSSGDHYRVKIEAKEYRKPTPVKKAPEKPESDDGWNVQPEIDALSTEAPQRVEQLFSDPDAPLQSFDPTL